MPTYQVPQFDAAIFDMDGLLLDSERVAFAALQDACRAFSCNVSIEVYCTMVGLNKHESSRVLARHLGSRVPIAEFETTWLTHIDRRYEKQVPIKPGAAEVLCHLATRQMPMAIATSTETERARWKLERAGLVPSSVHIIGGDQVAASKPAPDIFLEAAARLDVAPSKCIVFEDSENGGRGAVAAGMSVVLVPDMVVPSEELQNRALHVAGDLLTATREAGLIARNPEARLGKM
ncbi:MAG: HAD family hydrolase [Hyphomicrobiaceae bacterium]